MAAKDKCKVIDFLNEACKRGKSIAKAPKPPAISKAPKPPKAKVSQSIKRGSGNIQVAGDNNVTHVTNVTSAPKIKTLPSPDSIGGNPAYKAAIRERFNKLGDERRKRYGDNAFPVMYRKFKSDFGIKHGGVDTIWNWPLACATEIIRYLDDKYSNTIQGRIEGAAKRKGHLLPKPQLFKKETELLACLGLTTRSPEVTQLLIDLFGVSSHKDLSQSQHWQLVCHLESEVKRMFGE